MKSDRIQFIAQLEYTPDHIYGIPEDLNINHYDLPVAGVFSSREVAYSMMDSIVPSWRYNHFDFFSVLNRFRLYDI